MIRPFTSRWLIPCFALLIPVLLGATTTAIRAAGPDGGVGAQPVLLAARSTAITPRITTVSGDGFTPGGEVYIALYDQW